MADHDLLTVKEAKDALQIELGDTVDDTVIAHYVTAVSELIDREAGPVVRRTVTDERLDGGLPRICLRQRPVSSIASIVEYQYTAAVTLTVETPGTAPANGWLAEPYEPDPTLLSGTVHRRNGGSDCRWYPGRQNIVVTYSAGRYENTAAVAARFKRAAAITLVNLWRDHGPSVDNLGEVVIPFQSFPGFALPNAAAQLLAGEVGLDSPWGYR